MRRRISGAVILGLVTGLLMLALPAQAHSFTGEGDCDGWTLHLDGTWGAYDITVDGTSIGLEQNPTIPDDSDDTSRTFTVVWLKQSPVTRTVTVERSLDCDSETTTTLPEETTTTIPEETTIPETTTTVPNDTTTTVIETTTTSGLVGSFWSASSECQTLTAEWGDGISQVDVFMRDPQFGDIEVTPFTVSGETREAFTGDTERMEWILVPVTLSGYTAVPDEIHLFTEECTPATTTTVPTSSTLPFTGYSRMTMLTMIFVAAVSGILGFMFVMGARDDQ